MSTTVKVQIQQRIDTASAFSTANPTLLLGEVAWESDTKKYKIGDGNTQWSSLAYAPGSGGYTAGTGVSISASNVITASAVALSTIQTAANETAMLALTTQEGDVVVRSDQNKTYMKNSGTANSMADFTELSTPTDAVTSVNGNTGAITADQLAAAIESATDSNKFTDADHTKLNGIAASANNYSISTDLLDEDNFATNSATKVASQQSIKAYVDANSSSVIDEDDFASNSATVAPSQQSVKAYVDTADALKANLGTNTFTGNQSLGDNLKVQIGTGNDLQLFHDGTNSYITNATGNLIFGNLGNATVSIKANDKLSIECAPDAAVGLHYDTTLRAQTTSTGFNVIGALTVNGSALESGVSSDNYHNTFGGTGAGTSMQSSGYDESYNTFFGKDSGKYIRDYSGSNQRAYYNTCVGYASGQNAREIKKSVGVGPFTLYGDTTNTTTADFDVAVGYAALYSITTGEKNSGLGSIAGYSITTGSNNLCLGYHAGRPSSPSGTITTGSNNVVLGDDNITNLYCADTSISSSDSRDKTDVTNFTHGLSWINKLNPITYRWDKRTWYNEYNEDGSIKSTATPDGSKKKTKQHIGFLAQDVLAIEQADGFASKKDDMLVVNLNEDDTAYGLKYERLVPVLVNAIKELSTKVETLETKVAALESA